MTQLRRTEAAGFSLEDSLTLEQAEILSQNGELEQRLLPISALFTELPRLVLSEKQEKLYRNGVKLDLSRLSIAAEQGNSDICVESKDGTFLGISVADWEKRELKLKKLFALL